MAIFKCKMCGGTLNFTEGSTVAECECCGTKQTLPKLSDEKRANLYDRANHFRRNNDYDKALSIYEQILNEDKTDAEAYWSIVLCKYGIEYVEDPSNHKRIPTVNRTQFTSIFADEDYKAAIANADGYQRDLYEAEAKEIDKIQKGILAISDKESPYDVFICYKETDNGGRRTQDSVLAQDLYFGLKNEGFNVFFSRITLEDKLGSAYEPHIFAAIHSAKVMVVLGTKAEHFNAVWVKNEWSRYLALIKKGENKTLIPAYKDMDPYDLPDEFSHLQAQDMSKLGFMQDLLRGIKKIVEADREKSGQVKETVVVSGKQDITPLLKRAFLFLEDGDFTNADEYVEKVLDINPECAEAYIVKLLIDLRLRKPEQLTTCPSPIASNSNFNKAIRFASPEYRNVLQGYKNANIEHIAKAKEQARKEAIYEQALDRLSVAPDDIAYKKSIAELESIIDYKDAKEQIERIKTLLDAWYVTQEKERIYREEQAEKAKIYAEEQRLEKQRKLEQQKIVEQRAKAKKKKAMAIGIPSALVLFAIIVVTIVLLIPPSNIPYTVNHYLQNLDNEEYTLETSEELKGTANKTVAPAVKSFDGFTAPETQQVRVLEDGSLVVDYYYTRNSYTVTLTTNGGEEMQTISQKYQSTFSLATPERTGYTFGGWFSDINLSQAIPESIPAKNISVYAWWEEENKPSDFTYSGTDNITIESYVGNDKTLVIPAYIGGNKVTKLNKVCDNNDIITDVVIPDTVINVGDYSFRNCINLMSATIGANVTQFGSLAFSSCYKLVEIYNKSGITIQAGNSSNCYVGEYAKAVYTAPYISKLSVNDNWVIYDDETEKTLVAYVGEETNLIIPDDISNIHAGAFYNNNALTDIEIGQQIETIGNKAFYECSALRNIRFNAINCADGIGDWFTYAGKNTEGLNITIGKNVVNIPACLFYSYLGYSPKISNVFFEEGGSCATIGSNAFAGCFGFSSIALPASITQIGERAFYNTSLKEIYIPLNVQTIGNSAFAKCEMTIYCESEEEIDDWDGYFGWAGENTVYWGTTGVHGSTTNGFEWVQNCDDTLRIVKYTGSSTSLIIPETINDYAVADIEEKVFSKRNSLLSIEINSCGKIGYRAFEECNRLNSITIGKNVSSIGNYAFYNCKSLTEINFYASNCADLDLYSYCFDYAGNDKNGITVTIGKNVEKIPAYLFYVGDSAKAHNITNIIFEENSSCVNIGNAAFLGCAKINNIAIPNKVQTIGTSAFFRCSNLTQIAIPDSVKLIGESAFRECTSLSIVTMGKNVETIENWAFYCCSNLISIEIPEKIISMGDSILYGSSKLTEIKYNAVSCPDLPNSTVFYGAGKGGEGIELLIGKNVQRIPASLFSAQTYPPQIRTVTFEKDSICVSIGSSAFRYCNSLESVEIPKSVNSIGNWVFFDCNNLKTIAFEDSSTWYRTTSPTNWNNKTGGTETDLSIPETNITYFKSVSYCNNYWYKL